MPNHTFLSSFWEGFQIVKSHQTASLITLTLKPNSQAKCLCGLEAEAIHEYQWRHVKEAMLLGVPVELSVQTRRIKCRDCGIKTESLSWLEPYARITKRLKSYIEQLLPLLPIKHISQLTSVHWHTIKEIDKLRLRQAVPPVKWEALRQLVMDEFAIFKGHRYATVIADAKTHQVIWIGLGRSRKDIRPFFEQLGKHGINIEAVAMDMNTAFDLEVQAHCPNAKIVYDLFHVVAKFGREVMDRVRVDQANKLKQDKKARQWVKRSRWVLLKNRGNLNTQQDSYLTEILNINKDLMTTYILGAQLKELWYCESERHAKGLWDAWWEQVQESGIKPLKEFARKLSPYLHGIIASASYPLNTCTFEGINNKIKLVKRMGYGYRDTDYFFLKIKAAFPGTPR
ncbi:ISL3 family transposase [Vibrio scophthalmi]|uniref:Transposase for insertion sequence element IS1001 n=1 Tax=Vibrio scophthalmi TaxID=45658 RepID=A0A1E3WGJ8_9VIBR|nr:ISL3 family transposase [Vibrio scophthalmi]ODS04916.1 Transposase for insertion sequence element IS1001 [Vibrio scophthalmi]